MNWGSLADLVGNIVPALGSVISKVVPGSELVVSGLAALFGADPNSEEDIIKKIKADPQANLKLFEFQQKHQEAIYHLELQDRQNAREREIQFSKVLGKRDWVVPALGLSMVAGFFMIIALISFISPNPAFKETLYMLCGQCSSGMMLVLSYYFGSMNKQKK